MGSKESPDVVDKIIEDSLFEFKEKLQEMEESEFSLLVRCT